MYSSTLFNSLPFHTRPHATVCARVQSENRALRLRYPSTRAACAHFFELLRV